MRSFALAGACALALTFAASARAENASSALKAAFVYNFAKFTEWPADSLAASAPIVICVFGDAGVADRLVELTAGQAIGAHPMVVRQPRADGALEDCKVMYVSGLDGKRLSTLVAALSHSTVLTISDADGFAQRGGIVGLFVDAGRIRFMINLDSVHRSRLQLSSKLLTLGTIVKDDVSP